MFSRGCAALGGVLFSILVARSAGAEGLGSFAVFLSLLGALAILARHGQDMLLIRTVAWAETQAQSGVPISLLRHGVMRVAAPALILGVAASGLLASGWLGKAFPGTVAAMPLVLPIMTVLALVAGYAKGRSRAWLAPLFEIGGVSLLAAFLLAGFALLGPVHFGLSVTAAFLLALALLLVVALGMVLLDLPNGVRLPWLTPDQTAELRTGQMDFTLIALAMFLTQAGVFLLAAPFLPEKDLGLLRAAERLALLVSFSVLAINPVIAPRIVRLTRGGEAADLRRLIHGAVAASTGVAACVLLPLLIWPERALALMGAEFAEAVPYLRVLACAQLLAAAIGPLAMMLNMSGRERVSMWINVATLALAVALVPGLSLAYGAAGFAVAYAAIIMTRALLVLAAALQRQISPKSNFWSCGQ